MSRIILLSLAAATVIGIPYLPLGKAAVIGSELQLNHLIQGCPSLLGK